MRSAVITRLSFGMYLLSVVACLPISAQTVASDSQAVALMNACSRAMGSPSQSFAIEAVGTVVGPNEKDVPLELKAKLSGVDRIRWEVSGGSDRMLLTRDGMAVKESRRGVPRKLNGNDHIFAVPDLLPAYACGLSLQYFDVASGGQETVGGQLTDHLVVKVRQGTHATTAAPSTIDLYLDLQTHVIVALRQTFYANGVLANSRLMESRFGSYLLVAGVQVPQHIERYVSARKIQTIQLTSITASESTTTAEFQQ